MLFSEIYIYLIIISGGKQFKYIWTGHKLFTARIIQANLQKIFIHIPWRVQNYSYGN